MGTLTTRSGSFRAPFTVDFLPDAPVSGKFRLVDADGMVVSVGKAVPSGTVAGYVTLTGLPGLGALRIPANLAGSVSHPDTLPPAARQTVRNEILRVGLGGVYRRPIALHGRPNSHGAVDRCRSTVREGALAAGFRVVTRRVGPEIEAHVVGLCVGPRA